MRTHSALLFILSSGLCRLPAALSADPIMTDDPLMSDPDLLASLELFMGMSPSEREGAVRGLMDAAGDDPRGRAEMEDLLRRLPARPDSDVGRMVRDDEVAAARRDARGMLDGASWESLWENQAAILEGAVASGELSPEDAARFEGDEGEWEKQLRVIWEDLTSQQEL